MGMSPACWDTPPALQGGVKRGAPPLHSALFTAQLFSQGIKSTVFRSIHIPSQSPPSKQPMYITGGLQLIGTSIKGQIDGPIYHLLGSSQPLAPRRRRFSNFQISIVCLKKRSSSINIGVKYDIFTLFKCIFLKGGRLSPWSSVESRPARRAGTAGPASATSD